MPWLTDVTPFPFVMEEGYDLVEAKLRELGITKGKVGVDMMKFAMIDKIQRGDARPGTGGRLLCGGKRAAGKKS